MKFTGIFDSHAHYDDEKFCDDLEQVVTHIEQNGVCNVINAGCDVESAKSSIELAKRFQIFYAAVGVHPHHASEVKPDYIEQLKVLSANEHTVAIGEIGLDYHYDFSPRNKQIEVFSSQLKLAEQVNLPVIIHCREATADTMELLNQFKPQGVVHCFSGSAQTAAETVKLGMYIGLTGAVTFPNAKRVLEVIECTPMDRILLETDCPYMAPVPFRGKRTTSDMIVEVAKKVAEIKGISPQKVIDTARENTKTLFNIK